MAGVDWVDWVVGVDGVVACIGSTKVAICDFFKKILCLVEGGTRFLGLCANLRRAICVWEPL